MPSKNPRNKELEFTPTLGTQLVSVARCIMDELIALEVRLAKTKRLKQAMMQELLTGRIRLI